MKIEMLVGLNVIDDAGYQAYRDGMTPLLEQHGGGFGYDFIIAKVLRSETETPINRLFTINFPDEETMNLFFSNEDYLQVRKEHFEPSVREVTIIATYLQTSNT